MEAKILNKGLIQFFKNTMIKLNHHDWKLRFVNESYCWENRKIIDIGLRVKNKKQMILHEIAHIRTCRFCNQKHNPDFWKYFDDLLKRFLFEDICKEQLRHKKWSTKGKYGLIYI